MTEPDDAEHRIICEYMEVMHGVREFECMNTRRTLTGTRIRDMRYCPFCGNRLGWER